MERRDRLGRASTDLVPAFICLYNTHLLQILLWAPDLGCGPRRAAGPDARAIVPESLEPWVVSRLNLEVAHLHEFLKITAVSQLRAFLTF